MAYDSNYSGNREYDDPQDPGYVQDSDAENAARQRQERIDTIGGWYNQYLGRTGSSGEIEGWANQPNDLSWVQSQIQNSPEAANYAKSKLTPPPSGGGQQTGGSNVNPNMQRILDALGAVKSSDDPNYWFTQISKDPNGFGSAWDYWVDRINRGDGSELVRNGTLQKFNDNPGGPITGPGSEKFSQSQSNPSPFRDFSAFFQPNAIPGGILGDSNGFGSQLVNLLSQRAKQTLNIDPTTDSIIHPQVENAQAIQERNRRNYLNDLAESSSPYQTGALQHAARQTAEGVGQNVSALQSQLVQNELNARRSEIESALGQMGNLLTTDQYLSLQRELEAVNAGLKAQGLGQEDSRFYANLGQNADQFMKDLLFKYAGLNSQNDQFAANYNLNATDRANYWDWLRSNGGQ